MRRADHDPGRPAVEDAVAAADDRPAVGSGAPREAEARAPVVLVLADQSSVEPALVLLSKMPEYHTPYVRRDVATRAEFDHYVTKWLQAKYAGYPILYLAFHGRRGEHETVR